MYLIHPLIFYRALQDQRPKNGFCVPVLRLLRVKNCKKVDVRSALVRLKRLEAIFLINLLLFLAGFFLHRTIVSDKSGWRCGGCCVSSVLRSEIFLTCEKADITTLGLQYCCRLLLFCCGWRNVFSDRNAKKYDLKVSLSCLCPWRRYGLETIKRMCIMLVWLAGAMFSSIIAEGQVVFLPMS